MIRIAIVGGGITGLSAAFALEQRRLADKNLEYVLYESSPRVGGVLCTEHVDGFTVEAGPDSFLTEKPWAAELCHELGIADQLIGSNDFVRKTYILRAGRLVEMPDGLMFMVPTKIMPTALSPLFSWTTKMRMAREFFHSPSVAHGDESVASMVTRHYGEEMVGQLVDPLLSGIYGGSAEELSVRAVLPRFAEMEQIHGSLGRAMLRGRKKIPAAATSRPLFTSLKDGMEQMARVIVARLSSTSIRTNTRVEGISPDSAGWMISAGEKTERFDGVILALPAHAAAALIADFATELSAELSAIPYTSSITVALGYDAEVRRNLPAGFGFLVPRSEGRGILAATFVHDKFPDRASSDRVLLRCFFAGKNADTVWSMADTHIVEIVRDELSRILGLRAAPRFARVYKWKSAMAQYAVGHLDRLERIERLRSKFPRLALAGNGYRGIGIPDCVRSGRDAASQVLL
ncbi:MAG TPA: protoporphyrinogen oxidase [Candidatus Sulfotelmatobacter sp.]